MLNYHNQYMSRAIEIAKKASFKNKHNLLVGCVIVKNNTIISEGYYDTSVSLNHAEVNAINSSTENLEGSSIYVTLEPCFHTGKTPPCVDALILNKFKEVIIPFKDPNLLVNGKSIEKLQQAGIKVTEGVMPEECWKLNEEFLYYQVKKMPIVTAKWASSIDGKLCTYTKDSKWISSESARIMAHKLRSQNAAVLIGSNTLRLDDPLLNIRYNIPNSRKTIRIVLYGNSSINTKAQIWNNKSLENWIIIPKSRENDNQLNELYNNGVKIVTVKDNNGIIDFKDLLTELGKKEISSLLIEGGPCILSAMLEQRLVNKIEMFLAPLIIGGQNTVANFTNKDFQYVKNAEQFTIINNKMLENTIWISFINKKDIQLNQALY